MTKGDTASVSNSRLHLRLVHRGENYHDVIVSLNTTSDVALLSELLAEAEAIEAWYGTNIYSNFIKNNHRRPDRGQAATIGRLLGGQVKAADGSMQPPLTKADKEE